MNTPCALVVPEVWPKPSPAPLPDSVTAAFGTRLPWASSTVTVSVVVDTPSAVTDPGLATRVEVVADGAPGLNVTEVVSCTLPSVAVIVSVCANVEASVVVNTPFALVVPEIVPKLFAEPLPDSVTAAFGTDCRASSTVTVSVVVETPSAVTDRRGSPPGSRWSPTARPDRTSPKSIPARRLRSR